MKWETRETQENRHFQPEGRQKKKRMNVWDNEELCDVESSDLMFSIVSSGIGATVCTAGRFLLVAPLTNDEEEEVDEDAESVAPRQEGQWWKIKSLQQQKHDHRARQQQRESIHVSYSQT